MSARTDAMKALAEVLGRRHPDLIPSVVDKANPVRTAALPNPDAGKRAA